MNQLHKIYGGHEVKRSLYEKFPNIITTDIIIRKMLDTDVDDLFEICNNENIYKYTPDFLHKKSKSALKTAIKNLGERDFVKKKWIIAGVCLSSDPDKIIGTAEMFNYNEKVNMIEIGYRINENYWRQGVATKVIHTMADYLFNEIKINRIQATVMPENIYSARSLLKNGFIKEGVIREANYWAGKGVINLEMYSLLQTDIK